MRRGLGATLSPASRMDHVRKWHGTIRSQRGRRGGGDGRLAHRPDQLVAELALAVVAREPHSTAAST